MSITLLKHTCILFLMHWKYNNLLKQQNKSARINKALWVYCGPETRKTEPSTKTQINQDLF